jgi:hypothetical protein
MLQNTLKTFRKRFQLWLHHHPRIKGMLSIKGCLKFQVQPVARGIGIGLYSILVNK